MKNTTTTLILTICPLFCIGQSLNAGIQQYEDRQFQQAKSTLKKIDDDHKEYAQAQFYLGRIAFDNDEYEDAEEYFEEAIDTNEKNAEYHYWYGNAVGVIARDANVIKQGFLAPKIKSAYETAVELDPSMVDAHWGLVEYYTQAPGFMGGSWEKATETAKHIGTLNPERGHLAMATIFLRQENYDGAEKEYKELLKIDKKYKLNLGYFYQQQKQYDKAFDLFETEYKNDPDNLNALYQIGRTSAMSGQRVQRGINCLQNYLSKEEKDGQPSLAAAHMRLGMIYEKSGKNDLAITHYKKSLNKDSSMKQAKDGLKRLK